MKILNIDNTIKYELSETVVRILDGVNTYQSFEENENGELTLKGKDLKAKGSTIFKLVLLYMQKITRSFGVKLSEEQIDFQRLVVPKAIGMQHHLDKLTRNPNDFDSYWELISTLDAVMNYLSNRPTINQHLMG